MRVFFWLLNCVAGGVEDLLTLELVIGHPKLDTEFVPFQLGIVVRLTACRLELLVANPGIQLLVFRVAEVEYEFPVLPARELLPGRILPPVTPVATSIDTYLQLGTT